MKNNQQQTEKRANALQSEIKHIYVNVKTGRRVKIERINSQLVLGSKDNYEVQVSALELDLNKPHPIHLVEKDDVFFANYQAN